MQELELFADRFDRLLPRLRDLRRQALAEAGPAMLSAVRGRIGGTGRVQRWQETHMGSGGGYMAVRPRAETTDGHGYAVGYVTNAIEGGHRQEPGRYVPAIQRKLTREMVPGKYMYEMSGQELDRIAQRAADQVERGMARVMEE